MLNGIIFVFHFPVSSTGKWAGSQWNHSNILMLFLLSLFSVVFKTVINKAKLFNDVIKLWAGPKLLVFLADPRDIELILSSQVYLDKSPEYRFFKPWLGNGLLISSGEFGFRIWLFSKRLSFPFLCPYLNPFNNLSSFELKTKPKEVRDEFKMSLLHKLNFLKPGVLVDARELLSKQSFWRLHSRNLTEAFN